MRHITIDYGIDLGTTNSAICRMSHGVPTIIRSDAGTETMPSCINFRKGGEVRVGAAAYAQLGNDKLRALKKRSPLSSNSCIEFKRFMGSDTKYENAIIEHYWTPEQLSAQVVKALCSFVTDDVVKAAVITVPAKFTVNQKDATLQAARLAGIEQVELLQEPIAASMAYGLRAEEKNGIWMVFDFGGGTLDVALVHVTDGVMQIFDTEGDNYLGGKNIDETIVSKIILPQLAQNYSFDFSDEVLRSLLIDALKVEAEKLKIQLSYQDVATIYLEAGDWGVDEDGEDIEMQITVTRAQLEMAIRPLLQKAVDVCQSLMIRNNLESHSLSHLILIGGPTYIPLLRQMLREQVTPNVDTDINPMTAVAVGASIYASTIPVTTNVDDPDDDTLQLLVDFDPTTVDTMAFVPVKAKNTAPGLKVMAERRSDHWRSPDVVINEGGSLLELELVPNQPNTFRLIATVDAIPVKCFPSEITIVQGTKAGAAILPYNIGMEVFNPKKDRCVFVSLTGLEKNRPLPATGMVYGLKTLSPIMPGDDNTRLRIAIYQGDDSAEGKSAALFEYVSDVVISGDDVVSYVPKDSTVNIKIDVDRSEMMTITAEFADVKEHVEKRLDTSRRQDTKDADYLRDQISKARLQVKAIQRQLDANETILRFYNQLDRIEHDLKSNAQHKQIEQHIKEVLREIENYDNISEWDKAYKKVAQELYKLELEVMKHDEPNVRERFDSFSHKLKVIAAIKDIVQADSLRSEIRMYFDALTRAESYRNYIRNASRNYDYIRWSDPKAALDIIQLGMRVLKDNPNASLTLTNDIVWGISDLIITDSKSNSSANSANSYSPTDILSM